MMLYIHIPFCLKKCGYCDFLSFSGREEIWEPYVSALCRELIYRANEANEPLKSVYIGGGTPSILNTGLLERILNTVRSSYRVSDDAEITLECNPATVTKVSAISIAGLGVNRISIGLQSANEDELRLLGRAHNLSDFLFTYECFLKSGIDNISVDIMTGIPKQTAASLQSTLKTVTALRPAHISTYALTIEEGTNFSHLYKKGTYPLPDEDTEYELYKHAISYLASQGFERYEISNFAKPGRESRHNMGYWNRTPYIGVGLGASSLVNEKRLRNPTDIDLYIRHLTNDSNALPDDFFLEEIPLTKKDAMAEFMYLGLRTTEGILVRDFTEAFGESPESYYHDVIKQLREEGLLELSYGRLYLTPLGLDVSNNVLWRFLPDS